MKSLLNLVRSFSIKQAYNLGMRKLAHGHMPLAAAALKRAADGGHVGACYEMARLYEMGRGVICDLEQARRLARFAADAGYGSAMALAARLCLISPQRRFQAPSSTKRALDANTQLTCEPELARHYALLAHHDGNVDGSALAGYLLASGIGGDVDAWAALACYEPAVNAGHVRAHLGMGTLFAGGHLGNVDYAQALPYFKFAALAGNNTARHYLALQFLKGLGTDVDEERALKLLSVAAAKGYHASIEELSRYYLDDDHPERDRERGIRWLTALGRMGDQRACRELERRYRHGIDVEVDVNQAVTWLEKAALKGDVAAQFQMAVLSATTGSGETDPDYAQARLWFEMAADNGHTIAMVNLGRFRMRGVGGNIDLDGARDILEIAVEAGEMAAYAILGEFYAYYAEPANVAAARDILMHGVEKDDAVCKSILAQLGDANVAQVA